MTAGEIALVLLPMFVGLSTWFLSRKLRKLDAVHEWVCGTPTQLGAEARMRAIEKEVFPDPVIYDGPDRRYHERRGRDRR